MRFINLYRISPFILILFQLVFGQDRTLITGEYNYRYGDDQSLLEAKSICYNLALRNALEGYQIFVASTSELQNYQLRNDLIQTMASGYLEELKVVEETIKANSIYYKLQAYVEPVVFKKALRREVKRKTTISKQHEFISEGKYTRILKIVDNTSKGTLGHIKIIYQQKISGGERDKIMITYYDEDGIPIDGSVNFTHYNLEKNEVRYIEFLKFGDAVSYNVWYSKEY